MAWIYLALAGLFEIGFAAALKPADGFTRLWPSVIVTVLGLVESLLSHPRPREIPIGTAYAIWTGIGAVGAVLFGIFAYNEPMTPLGLFFIAALIASIIGLKIVTP